MSSRYDLSSTIPGTDLYMKTYVARYIEMGGEFPPDYIVEYMKTCSYPQMFGKRMFPGYGLTIFNNEQEARRITLKQAVNIDD